jgi:hypothetical protein
MAVSPWAATESPRRRPSDLPMGGHRISPRFRPGRPILSAAAGSSPWSAAGGLARALRQAQLHALREPVLAHLEPDRTPVDPGCRDADLDDRRRDRVDRERGRPYAVVAAARAQSARYDTPDRVGGPAMLTANPGRNPPLGLRSRPRQQRARCVLHAGWDVRADFDWAVPVMPAHLGVAKPRRWIGVHPVG